MAPHLLPRSLGLIVVLGTLVGTISPRSALGDDKKPADVTDVQATIKILDPSGAGTFVEAKKMVPTGTNAFDLLRSIVQVDYTTHPQFGAFVKSLAGVPAPAGHFWELIVDGMPSQVGISGITITKKIEIIWRLSKIESKK